MLATSWRKSEQYGSESICFQGEALELNLRISICLTISHSFEIKIFG